MRRVAVLSLTHRDVEGRITLEERTTFDAFERAEAGLPLDVTDEALLVAWVLDGDGS